MNWTYRLLTIVCLPVFAAVAAESETKPAAEEKEAAASLFEDNDGEGWIALFNGKDLTGWRNAREPEADNKWLVEDGCLTNKDHANNIGTVKLFKDFGLKLEYKIVEDGNSGVYLRGRVEIQILDSFDCEEEPGKGDDGAFYDQHPPLKNASKPAGEWNRLEAIYRGDVVSVTLNGVLVQDNVQIAEPTGGALPGHVNFPGPLMLQGDHGKIWFRNMEIKPLRCAPGSADAAE